MNLENVTRDDWIVGGLALLLAIDLLFLPWFEATATIGSLSVSASSTATGDPDGWLGILAVVAALGVLVDIAIERFSPQTQLPAIGGSRTSTRLMLAGVAALFIALKFLFHIHFSLFAFGFYAAVVLAAALLYFAIQTSQSDSIAPSTPAGRAGRSGSGGQSGSAGSSPPST